MYALLLLFGACLCACASARSVEFYAPENAEFYFENFIKKFSKNYSNTNEKTLRFELFKQFLDTVNELNNKSTNAIFGITKFADFTPEELSKYNGLGSLSDAAASSCSKKTDADIPDGNAPDSLDWRDKNIVTPVKNQGSCGSCWSFSSTGHLEGQYALKHAELISFSEQQLVDCGGEDGNNGCNGGLMHQAFKTVKRLGGNAKEEDYPYEESEQDCRSQPDKVIPTVTDCTLYDLRQQDRVKELLNSVGPIAIAVKGNALPGYTGGVILDKDNRGELNHGVLLVGYGTDPDGTPYWLVKNSWGEEFGEQGYFRMERSDNPEGALGMMNPWMATAEIQ